MTIQSDDLRLEGVFIPGEAGLRPVLLCAPHPSYGGNMLSELIVTVGDALSGMGHPSLRFNYRGVGGSQGTYAGGMGEAKDTRRAADFLCAETGADRVMVCGYSFGAWVALKCAHDSGDISPLVLVSPPNTMLDFDYGRPVADTFVFAGTNDEFCSMELLETQFPGIITPIEGADHFYSFGLDELTKRIRAVAARIGK
ncbi:MAG: alpha/beta fold hydrolase [Pseudomonadota bacterium]